MELKLSGNIYPSSKGNDMTQNSASVQEEIILGKTHFQIPGNDKLIPFSREAIEKDQRHREALMAMSDEILGQVKQDAPQAA